MIVPRNHSTWLELVRHLTREQDRPVAWSFTNFYFFVDKLGLPREEDVGEVDVPDYLHMMKYIYRTTRYSDTKNRKTFIDPERVLVVTAHHPTICFGECSMYNVEQGRSI